jgi:ferredoxin-type protein NapH
MILEFKKKRSKLQVTTSIILPIVLVGGWFYPPLGFFLLACMIGSLAIAWEKGRKWCDWSCPRGAFYDVYLSKISQKAIMPSFMKTHWFRSIILGSLLIALSVQVYFAWGDFDAVGLAFVRVLTITTAAGIILGTFFHERAWCHICPMGTLGNWASMDKQSLHVNEECKSCKLCAKVCPMQLKPYEHKAASMHNGDCLKCKSCVVACPIDALGFVNDTQKAA